MDVVREAVQEQHDVAVASACFVVRDLEHVGTGELQRFEPSELCVRGHRLAIVVVAGRRSSVMPFS